MNPITLAMDALLAALLLAALFMGVRLNGRLKALKDSHQGFAIAVHELDAAATKADAALKALHAASEEAHDSLLARIDTARALALKLEKASETAENAARRAEDAFAKAPVTEPAPSSAATPRRSLGELLAGRAAARQADPEPQAAARTSPHLIAPSAPPAAPHAASLALVASTPRRRPIADEDLFAEAEEGVRPGLTGLMRASRAKTLERGAR